MKCPHCSSRISILSNAMNSLERTPACPTCGGAFIRTLDYKFIALWALPALLLTMALERFLGSFSFVPGVALLLILGYDLKLPATAESPSVAADSVGDEKP
jgi:membrane protein DedA with SNARE-associated domain